MFAHMQMWPDVNHHDCNNTYKNGKYLKLRIYIYPCFTFSIKKCKYVANSMQCVI